MAAPFGYEVIAPSSATKLTIPNGAYSCYLTVETQNIRWTVDGTTPTNAVGNLLAAGSGLEFIGFDVMRGLQIIETTASSSVKVSYFPRIR